jgi:uncharacterized membrane protein
VHRNIRTILAFRARHERRRRRADRVADAITGFTGSMPFVLLHAAGFASWIVANLGVVPGVAMWDPYPFVMLAMAASVEAIFLSTFVLISQNRMAEVNRRQADLDLQINLLSEHEITRLAKLLDAVAQRLGVGADDRAGIEELKRDVLPEQVLEAIEKEQSPPPPG